MEATVYRQPESQNSPYYMTYHRETGQVEYQSKDEKETKVFDALEWLAAMCSHMPNKG